MYNFNHLYYFFITAKAGSVSNAAKYLHISQPSLSSQIKILESSMDKKLFEKKGRGLALTTDGERAFAYCKKIFGIAEEMKYSLEASGVPGPRRIHIGVSDQLEQPFIADILSPLLKDRPAGNPARFAVSSGRDTELLNSLRAQSLDLILTNKAVYGDDLNELCSVRMPVQLMVSSASMKKAGVRFPRQASVADFMQKAPWGLVMPSEVIKLRQETDIFFQEIQFRQPIVFESDMLSVVGRAILDGAGIGFLPVPYVREEIKLGLINAFGPRQGFWKHMLYLIARKQETYDPSLTEIKKYMRELERRN